ncbi:TRAP transporter small permease [Caenispirillum bisanense]|uniref:TRAP transporter small permease protein n=1 Tax=Caenispirillum bisanense TaxID=414052 RepID=A0A286GNH4_9PROT|nr:TRAP transporter small permease [Caenispirillum bisanense]SOD96716.1 C4-dicarboxylate transporter, DctQ subunit [Caenispirillum bisanense]
MVARTINRLEEAVISILLVSMTLIVFLEVVMRFVFNSGLKWAQEATLYASAWMVLFGISYVLKVGGHIGVDALVRIFSRRVQRIVTIVAVLCCLAYVGIIAWGAWVYLSKLFSIGIYLKDVHVPRWLATSILFVGVILFGLRFALLLVQLIKGEAHGFGFHDESKDAMRIAEEVDETGGGKIHEALAMDREGDRK